jgi:sulfate permease
MGAAAQVPANAAEIVLLLASIFFALNMGGSGMAPAFSTALGARLVSTRTAVALFGVCVLTGALTLGGFVAKTLGSGLVPAETFDVNVALAVILSAAFALLLANLLKIPQSTSWVTVFAIATVGVFHDNLKADTILYHLLPAWIGLPLASFVLTTALARFFYPIRAGNVRSLERLAKHERLLKGLVLAGSCYVALAIGSNNVANVVGPLAAANVLEVHTGFVMIAPLFGLGGLLFRAPAETMAKEIVPLGLATAAISSLVTGSLLLCASWLGIPQSLVQINAGSLIAVSLVKEESWGSMRGDVLSRIGGLWLATPLIAALMTAALLQVLG